MAGASDKAAPGRRTAGRERPGVHIWAGVSLKPASL